MHLNWQNALDQSVLKAIPPGKLGVAVSGGGDSVALLQLLTDWAGRELHVVTVDHDLRTESAEEAEAVGVLALQLGLSHQTLKWTDKSGGGQSPGCCPHGPAETNICLGEAKWHSCDCFGPYS